MIERRIDCGVLRPGLHTVVLFQLNVKDPFPYTAQIYFRPRPDRSQRWNLWQGEEKNSGKKKPGKKMF